MGADRGGEVDAATAAARPAVPAVTSRAKKRHARVRRTDAHMHAHIHAFLHTQAHTHTHACAYTHMHAHTLHAHVRREHTLMVTCMTVFV